MSQLDIDENPIFAKAISQFNWKSEKYFTDRNMISTMCTRLAHVSILLLLAQQRLCLTLAQPFTIDSQQLARNLSSSTSTATSEHKSGELSCIDEDGKETDWFIAYKFPILRDQNGPLSTGYAYSYIGASGRPKQSRQRKSSILRGLSDDLTSHSLSGLVARMFNFFTSPSTNKSNNHMSYETEYSNEWIISQKLINNPESAIFRTLAPVFPASSSKFEIQKNATGQTKVGVQAKFFKYGTLNERNTNEKNEKIDDYDSSLSLIFYNDQPPDGSDHEAYAHAKGVVIMDDISHKAIWLSHSTPKFPPVHTEQLEFHSNTVSNGQTFMCLSFDVKDSGKKIAEHLLTMNPYVYDSVITERLLDIVPEFKHFIWTTLELTQTPDEFLTKSFLASDQLHSSIDTISGMKIDLFSKSHSFDKDLYDGWLTDELETNLFVQSWQNGGGDPLNSSCLVPGRHVDNVESMQIIKSGKQFASWSHHHDHSKWSISDVTDKSLFCISDINRMRSQFHRGGGALCVSNPDVWQLFKSIIKGIDECPA